MAGPQKVIITCALTGSGHTPSMSAHLPYTVEDVVAQGVAAAEAGASVLHLHARNPKDGSPTADPAVFAEYARGIREREFEATPEYQACRYCPYNQICPSTATQE